MTRNWGPATAEPPAPGGGTDLAARQAELVAALVGGAPVPAGFDPARIAATRRALLRKRAAAAATAWPRLAASLGPDWLRVFAEHAADRPGEGGLRDGWDLARALHERGALGRLGAAELAEREATLRYDGRSAPRPRPFAALRRLLRGR